jgi:hypothetical protein
MEQVIKNSINQDKKLKNDIEIISINVFMNFFYKNGEFSQGRLKK